jgi:hypothetical protein
VKVRLALAGVAVAFAAAPLAPAQASCGPVVVEACRIVCRVPNEIVYRTCTIL